MADAEKIQRHIFLNEQLLRILESEFKKDRTAILKRIEKAKKQLAVLLQKSN